MEFLSNFVTINLEDGMGNNITIQVSSEDAERAGHDLAFAQQLMEMAMLEERSLNPQPDVGTPLSLRTVPSGPSSSTSSSNSPEEESEEAATTFKWPHKAILLLVDTYKAYERDLTSGKVSKKRTWEKISKVMEEHGYGVSGPQCLSKFSGMKKTFKAISDHNSKSGNNPRSWPYVELMQELIGERPFMQPVALASSTSSNGSMNTVSESSLEASTESRPFSSSSAPRKRKTSDGLSELSSAILESRRIVEENKNRRHFELLTKV